ncbi:adenylate kinase 7a [Silurus meridionalis]|uniref:Uncharacterized protein n=1 Tax=Silurus meridionalis TaxID=175797 RepID=A0A8T0AIH2_SILME|nr:adenylate kinase 7a [Silurus meridionalis]KAF7690476.1 hypothetical protein HF521_012280 [Silurus meridionalis]
MAGVRKQVKRSKRIFINHIDSYSSKHIAKYLSKCATGSFFEEPRPGERFEIVGTVINKDENQKKFALEEYSALQRDELLQILLGCDVVVYNISEDAKVIDEATWAVSALFSEIEHFTSTKIFILVSTLMTWAKTNPGDPDNPETPVNEEDYTRKRPHPNFKEHASAEKLVLKLGKTEKSKLRTYVIGAGMQYGMEEGIFHFFFKACWLGQLSQIPIPEPGTNIIPTIHVYDLAGIVQNVISHKSKMHYLIAVDDSHNSLEDIVKAVANVLGPGEVQNVPTDNLHLTKELTGAELACISVNLLIETVLLKTRLNVSWVCESGLVKNIERVVEEYRQARGFYPIKICLLGPPAVGKSSIAAQLCKYYKLHHIGSKETVQERIRHLEELLQCEEKHTEETLQATEKQLNALKYGLLGDQIILHIIREKLQSKPCRNHGYVLDGFPCTLEQANRLFNDEEKEPENIRSNLLPHDEKTIPEHVFFLDANDEFLKERVRNLPQSIAEEMHYTQDEFVQRLSMFRDAYAKDETTIDYFDELEIHPEHIEINSMNDPENGDVVKKIIKMVGAPRNYGFTPEEVEEQERKQAAEKKERTMKDAAERAHREAEELTRLIAQLEEWDKNRMEVEKQEHELLEARSLPLRHYLMKYVMPALREGLVACCKVKPDQPIDFLAEYLLRNNAED